MRLVKGWLWAMLGVVQVACGQQTPEPGGYVLIDREARAAGFALSNGDEVVPATLPVGLDGTGVSVLVGGDVETPLSAELGELVTVRGREAKLERWVIGLDIESDVLDVEAPEAAAQALAAALGADLVARGTKWRLTAPDALHAASRVRPPSDLVGLEPVETTPVGGAALTTAAAQPPPEVPTVAPVLPGATALAGATIGYPAGLVSQGVPCPGVAGTWRGRMYSEFHEAWYEFTLTVRQPSPDSGKLSGEVLSHSWVTAREQVDPPRGCRGIEQWKVKQPARGTVHEDGTIEFDGQSWSVTQRLCGDFPSSYCVDHFKGKLGGGGTLLIAEGHDHCVWTDEAVVFTRVSC